MIERDGTERDESAPRRTSLLERGLQVLESFTHHDREVSLAELTRRTGLPKPTVYRIANELGRFGLLERTAHGYRLGVRTFMLGQRVPWHTLLRDLAMPYLEDLYEATHENISLAVLHGTETLFLARLNGHRSSDVELRVGDTLPAYSTSSGKALLANAAPDRLDAVIADGLDRLTPHTTVLPGLLRRQLEQVRRDGFAVNHEETHRGVSSVAAPVLDESGVALAAISVTGRGLDTASLSRPVRTAAEALSREVARHPRLLAQTG